VNVGSGMRWMISSTVGGSAGYRRPLFYRSSTLVEAGHRDRRPAMAGRVSAHRGAFGLQTKGVHGVCEVMTYTSPQAAMMPRCRLRTTAARSD
jgi:hypothetical protein